MIGPDSMLLIHPSPLEIDAGTLMQGVGDYERECYPINWKLVEDAITAKKTVREMTEGEWPFSP